MFAFRSLSFLPTLFTNLLLVAALLRALERVLLSSCWVTMSSLCSPASASVPTVNQRRATFVTSSGSTWIVAWWSVMGSLASPLMGNRSSTSLGPPPSVSTPWSMSGASQRSTPRRPLTKFVFSAVASQLDLVLLSMSRNRKRVTTQDVFVLRHVFAGWRELCATTKTNYRVLLSHMIKPWKGPRWLG